MGKIRVKTFGDEEQEAKDKAEMEAKKAEKKARLSATDVADDGGQTREDSVEQNSESSDVNDQTNSTAQTEAAKNSDIPEKTKSSSGGKKKKEKFIKKKVRSVAYKAKIMEIEKNKVYSLTEGIELLRKVKIAKFDETVELHINTTEAGINGTVKLPHGTGKEIRVAVATDELIEQIEKGLPAGRQGKINFDILIASPDMMPKLARVARVLGPKGLMPNPKNGTISQNPEEAAKKFQGGQIGFKTESKLPIIHLSVGKTSFEDKQLEENIKTIIAAVKRGRIRNITLKSTMSPGIRIQA